jgi:aspartokinase-like uncharacterized kinase
VPDVIVKIGGGLLAAAGDLDRVVTAVAALARVCRVLVVPGGGPFADAVRDVDRRLRLPHATAHWMAVLAMDQYAHLIASRVDAGIVVFTLADAIAAADDGRVPVLAPFRWLHEEDPLPHAWEVTSDSIAAWISAAAGAREIVVVKPRGASGANLVDPCFARVLPWHVAATIVPADEVERSFAAIAARMNVQAAV